MKFWPARCAFLNSAVASCVMTGPGVEEVGIGTCIPSVGWAAGQGLPASEDRMSVGELRNLPVVVQSLEVPRNALIG